MKRQRETKSLFCCSSWSSGCNKATVVTIPQQRSSWGWCSSCIDFRVFEKRYDHIWNTTDLLSVQVAHEVRNTNSYAEFPTQPNSEMSMMTPSGPLNLISAFLGGAPRDDWRLPVSFRGVSRVAPAYSILWAQSMMLSTINPMWLMPLKFSPCSPTSRSSLFLHDRMVKFKSPSLNSTGVVLKRMVSSVCTP